MGSLNLISRYVAVIAVIVLAVAVITSQVMIVIIALFCLLILLLVFLLWRNIKCKRIEDARICREPTIKLPEKIAMVCILVGIVSFFIMQNYEFFIYPFILAIIGVIMAYGYNAINTFEAGGLFFPGISVAAITAPVICCLFIIGFSPLFSQSLVERTAVVCITAAIIWVALFISVKIKCLIQKLVLKHDDPRRPFDFNISFNIIGMVIISIGVLALGNVAASVFIPNFGEVPMHQMNLNVPEVPLMFPTYEDRVARIEHLNISTASPNRTILGTTESMDQFSSMVDESGYQLMALFADSADLLGLGEVDYINNMTDTLQKGMNISKSGVTKK